MERLSRSLHIARTHFEVQLVPTGRARQDLGYQGLKLRRAGRGAVMVP